MESKKWYRSKVLKVNLIGLIGIILTIAISEDAGAQWLAAEASILAVANLILRLVTKQPLKK